MVGFNRLRRIERTSNWQNRARRRHRAAKMPDHPVGPRLVRGRGVGRRRRYGSGASWLLYLAAVIALWLMFFT